MTLLDEETVPYYPPGAASDFSGGRWAPSARTAATRIVTIEPLISERTGGEVEQIERLTGRSLTGGIRVFCETALHALDPFAKTEGGWVVWQGKTYEIVSLGTWPGGTLTHYEALAAIMDPQPVLP